jgi:hypothetical protein
MNAFRSSTHGSVGTRTRVILRKRGKAIINRFNEHLQGLPSVCVILARHKGLQAKARGPRKAQLAEPMTTAFLILLSPETRQPSGFFSRKSHLPRLSKTLNVFLKCSNSSAFCLKRMMALAAMRRFLPFGPSPLARLLRPLLTSAARSKRIAPLSAPISGHATDLPR